MTHIREEVLKKSNISFKPITPTAAAAATGAQAPAGATAAGPARPTQAPTAARPMAAPTAPAKTAAAPAKGVAPGKK